MKENCVFIDFDDVIVDSNTRMIERKEKAGFLDHKDRKQFIDYFTLADQTVGEWEYIIKGAKSINNSVEIMRELEKIKKDIVILTKIHSLKEMCVKIEDLRENRHIYSPIVCVPPGIEKYNIIIPNGRLLIDDSSDNVNGWIQNGGTGLIFERNLSKNSKTKIRSLDFLLRG